jgi:hypothetical protein
MFSRGVGSLHLVFLIAFDARVNEDSRHFEDEVAEFPRSGRDLGYQGINDTEGFLIREKRAPKDTTILRKGKTSISINFDPYYVRSRIIRAAKSSSWGLRYCCGCCRSFVSESESELRHRRAAQRYPNENHHVTGECHCMANEKRRTASRWRIIMHEQLRAAR